MLTIPLKMDAEASHGLRKVLANVLLDLVPVLLRDLDINFLLSADYPMPGTDQHLARFQVSPALFDAEVRAALRAKGLNVPESNLVFHASSPAVENGCVAES
jgi:hypothetical protein